MKTAIVLSGGGAKGAYQVGVWKALRKLGITYDIVTGTSVGALNGVLMVQHDYHTAIRLWENIDYSFLFNKDFSNVDKTIYLTYIKEFVKEGGMDITNLEQALDKFLDPQRFFTSSIDFGIVVYNLSQLKEEFLTKKNLNTENIKDYVIASATCYPAFKIKKIHNEKYIDGGFYDNLPINLAIDLGADRIIAVDLKAPGIKQKIKDKNKEIINIIPNNNIGTFLEFDKYVSRKNIKYGYNDTMKTFGKLIGKKYTFYIKPYVIFAKKILKKFNKILSDYLKEDLTIIDQLKTFIPKLFLKNKVNEEKLLDIIEFAGKVLELDDSKKYILSHYNYLLKKQFNKIPKIDEKLIKEKIDKKDFSSLLESKYMVKYLYQNLAYSEKYSEIYSLAVIFKKEFLTAIYLISIGC